MLTVISKEEIFAGIVMGMTNNYSNKRTKYNWGPARLFRQPDFDEG